MRSPSITSSHLNAVAPLLRINRINSDAETLYRVQQQTTISQSSHRVTSVVPSPKGTYKSSAFRGIRVFSDRKESLQPKKVSPPPQPALIHVVEGTGGGGVINGTRRNSPPIQSEPKKQVASSSNGSPPKSRGERLEEQRQRREFRKRETLTTTPGIRVRPTTIFDSLIKRR